MVQYHDHIPEAILGWIPKQEMFWVATAPLTANGHVNVSPKGLRGTFHVTNPNQGARSSLCTPIALTQLQSGTKM
jgi:hypothetical protein